MSEKIDESKLEKIRKLMDKVSIGLMAVGVIFGIPALFGASLVDLMFSKTAGKEINKELIEKWEKYKKMLNG